MAAWQGADWGPATGSVAADATPDVAETAENLFTVATQGLSGADRRADHRGMTALASSSATSSPPLVRLTLTLGPEDRHALAQFLALSGAASRPDAVRELAARLSAAPSSARSRLTAVAVPPLPVDSSQSRRLDARIAADDRAAFERWCGAQLRPQDALRAALHLLVRDSRFGAELGYGGAAVSAPTLVARPARQEPVQAPRPAPRDRVVTPTEKPPAPTHIEQPPTQRPPPPPPRRSVQRAPRQPAWPPPPRAIPAVEVADDWETGILLRRLKAGRADMHFAPAWTDEVEAAVEDLVEILGSGDSITVVAGIQRDTWEERDEDGEILDSGTTWTLVPVPRPKSIAHDMLVSAHAAGGVDLEARVHRVDDEGTTGAIVELVVTGAF